MGRHSGKNLKITHGASDDEIDGCVGFDFDETAGTVDLTAAGDAWADHDTTHNSWSGTINMKADHAALANQTLRAGDILDVKGYTEGDGSGSSYVSGNCIVVSHKLGATYDGEATREYSVTGKGALTVGVVA